MSNMFNITLATLFPLPDEVDDRNEPPLLAMLWTICLEFIIAFLSIWILSERFLRIKTKQEMAEREGKLAEHKGKLAELISEFKQVSIYAHGLITDADDFVIPFHETMIGFFEIKDLIAGALWDDTKDGVNPAAAIAAAAAGVEISSSALCPHNIFMRKAEECLILIASARKSLRDLCDLGYDDAVARAGPIDARYAHGLAEFKRRLDELEARWVLDPDSNSDLENEDNSLSPSAPSMSSM